METGAEKLAFQGVFLDIDIAHWRHLRDVDLGDLAGNAFSSTVFMAVALAVLTRGVGGGRRRRRIQKRLGRRRKKKKTKKKNKNEQQQ